MEQGCLERAFGLHTLAIQTASTGGLNAEMMLTGIMEPQDFRRAIFAAKAAREHQTSAAFANHPLQRHRAPEPDHMESERTSRSAGRGYEESAALLEQVESQVDRVVSVLKQIERNTRDQHA